MYDSKYCNLLTIACYDMQFEDDIPQIFFWENLDSTLTKNRVVNVNFKGFIANNAHANWIVNTKIYSEGEPILPVVGCKRTPFFHWSQRLDKVTQKYI